MLQRLQRRLVGSTTLIVTALTTVSCSDQFGPNPPPPPHSAEMALVQAPPLIFVGAGDIASCTKDGDTKTALLVESILNANPTAWAFIAGDNVYEDGSTAEYRDCYGPTWGRFKSRTRPSLGNHEYDGTEGSKPSFDYFGDALWNNSRPHGYYSYNLGDSWHIVVLNSNTSFVSTSSGSAQDNWLKADLAANNRPCIAAYWHHPRFFSSQDAASSLERSYVKPFWDRLYAAGADLVVVGHSHTYERFAPQKPDGTVDRTKGIRQFIVGTGGKGAGVMTKFHPASEVRNGTVLGVIEFTLGASSYSWRFVPEAGKSFNDTGTSNCHGTPPANVAPTAAFTQPSCTAGAACTFTAGGTDTDGTIKTRVWDFGDPAGTPVSTPDPTIQHTYAAAGPYSVTLKVIDDDGATSPPVTKTVTVAPPPPVPNVPPTADFSPPSCTAALACTFTAGGNDPDGTIQTREWDFGDPPGTPIATTNVATQHTYAAAGSYPVILKVIDDDAAASIPVTKSVTVIAPNIAPTVKFEPPSCVVGVPCAFDDKSTDTDGTIVIRKWDFDDGTAILETGDNPVSHIYTAAGTYDVSLTVTDDDGAKPPALVKDVTVNALPVAAFTPPACIAGVPCDFDDQSTDPDGGSITNKKWDFGDGPTIAATAPGPVSHTYGAAGPYHVTLTVTDNNGGESAVGHDVTVAENALPVAAFTPPACTTGVACSFQDESTDDDGTIVTRKWDFGDPPGTIVGTASHTYTTPGEYPVTLTVVDNGGATSAPAAHPVIVSDPPNVPPTAAFTLTCDNLDCVFTDESEDTDGTIATRSWDYGDGSDVSATTGSHSFAPGGPYIVKLTVKDDDEAEHFVEHEVTVVENVPPTAAFTWTCDNLDCDFSSDDSKDTDGTIASRSWEFGEGGVSTQPNPTHSFAPGGPYTVRLVVKDDDEADHAAEHEITVVANILPQAAFTRLACTTMVACSFQDESTDEDGTIVKRKWDFGNPSGTVVSTTDGTLSHTYAAAGPYTVTLTVEDDDEAGSEPVAHEVTVSDPPNVPPTAAFTLTCDNLDCVFTDESEDTDGTIATRSWDYGDGSDVSATTGSHSFAPGGPYIVKLTVKDDDEAEHFVEHEVTVVENVPPTAAFTWTCHKLDCAFTNGSDDTDGTIASVWDFGDGGASTQANPTHSFAPGDPYTVKLVVKDDDDAEHAIDHEVTVVANVPPTAAFGPDCTYLACTFTDASDDTDGSVASRSWDFGDEKVSSATSPTHTYAAPGLYTVGLTVKDDDQTTSELVTHEVTVEEPPNVPPTAAFTWTCDKLDCGFSSDDSKDTDGTIASRSWDFGDGGVSTQANPTYTFAPGGPYTVKLTVKDDDDAEHAIDHEVTVVANVPPTAAFTWTCDKLDCGFSSDDSKDTDGTIASRSWDFGDGGVSTQSNPTHTFAPGGPYTVKLLVKDDDNAEHSVDHSVVVVGNASPTAAFDPSCTNLSCSFTDQSSDADGTIATRSWRYGDGTPDGTTASHVYTAGGPYSVTLTVTDDDGAPDAVSHDVTVSPANVSPTAAFSRACTNLACTFTDQSTDPDPGGSIKTWAWNFGDGSSSTVKNPPLHAYTAGGSKTVTLSVTDNADKPSATPFTQTFTVAAANVAPTASFTSSCSGLTCSFTNGSTDSDGTITARSWNFGDGGTSSSTSPSRTYAAAGTYTVRLTVTDNNGATGTTTRSVTTTAPANRLPSALFGSACTKLSCVFTDRSTDPDGNGTITKWSWAFGDGATSTTRNPTRVYKAGGSYKVKLTVTDNRGGTDPITHTVTVAP